MKTYSTEIKTDSKWTLVKTTYEHGVITYQFKNGNDFMNINGTVKFANAIAIQHGFGAVAIQNKNHKTVKIEWHIVNEDGKIVKSFGNLPELKRNIGILRIQNENTIEM